MGLIQGFKGMILPTGVSLSANTASIGSGVEYQLIPYITPALSSNNKIHWSTNNNNVTVDDNGVVTGVTDGTSIVTATTDYGGYTASCTFTVFTIPVTGISLNESSVNLSPGKTIQLEAIITPDNATNKRVTWRSTDTSVATVDSNGLVTCLAGSGGTADIIATTADGNYTATCTIKQGWGPGVNTLLYVPMETDLLDYSGNNIDITNYGISVNNTVLSDIGVGYFKGSADDRLEFSGITFGTNSFTISRWEKSNSTSSGSGSRFSSARIASGSWCGLLLGYNQTNLYAGTSTSWNIINGASAFNSNTEDWVHWTVIRDGNNRKTYRNKTLYWSGTASGSVGYNTEVIGNYRPGDKNPYNGYMSRFIIESSVWDENYISEYIDLTKADYEDKIENYNELEYIESDGNQYIDTNVKASNNISTELVMRPNMSYTSEYAIFGDAWSANALFLMEYQGRYRLHNGGNYGDYANVTNAKTTITTNNTGLNINGTNYTLNAGSSYSSNNIWIFATGDGGNTGKRGRFKLYEYKIYSNGELIREFMPAQRKSDGVLGLYDKIENKFYTNKGSGTFTAGPKIGVTLNKNKISLTEAGQTEQLTVTANPSSIGSQGYQWRSSDTTIATVSSNGLVTCVMPGECIITCTAVNGGYTDTCSVDAVSSLNYIYNFDDGTWTNDKLTADGWVNEQYGLNASSEGLVFADTGTDRGGIRVKQITGLSGYSKVTVYFKGVKNGSWGGAMGGLITKSGSSNVPFIQIRSNYYSPQANGVMINNSWVHQKGFSYSVEGTVIVDFANGTRTSDIDGSTSSGTISGFTLPDSLYLYGELSKGYYGTPSAIYKLHVTFE